MLICFGIRCEAQTVKVVERLPDGGLILDVDGVQQRSLTAAQLRAIAEDRAEMDRLRREVALLREDRDVLRETRDVLRRLLDLQTQQTADWKLIADSRQGIILRHEALAPAKSRATSWLDSPIPALAFRVGIPIVTTWLSARK